MPTYKIEITETLQRQIEVEASSKEEALKKIKEQYQNQEIVLNENDYVDTEYSYIEKIKNKNEQIPGEKTKWEKVILLLTLNAG